MLSKFPQPPYSGEKDSNRCKEWRATAGGPSFLLNPLSGPSSLRREEGTTPPRRHRNGATLWTSSGRVLPSQPGRQARRGGVPFPRRSSDPLQAASTPPPHPGLELPLPAPEEGVDGEGTGADVSRFLEAGGGERRLSFSSPATCYEAGERGGERTLGRAMIRVRENRTSIRDERRPGSLPPPCLLRPHPEPHGTAKAEGQGHAPGAAGQGARGEVSREDARPGGGGSAPSSFCSR